MGAFTLAGSFHIAFRVRRLDGAFLYRLREAQSK